MSDHVGTDEFRGAYFRDADLSGASFRECDLRGVRVVGSLVEGLRVSSFAGKGGRVVVDDVDVSAFVASELDRRHPLRVRLRDTRTADEHRTTWAEVERQWDEAAARAERLAAAARHTRVEEEWWFAETLRHLAFAVDLWVGRVVRQEEAPFDPLDLPHTDYPAEGAPELGIDLAAEPTYDEARALHASRRRVAGEVLAALSDEQLDEVRTLAPRRRGGSSRTPCATRWASCCVSTSSTCATPSATCRSWSPGNIRPDPPGGREHQPSVVR